MTLNDTVASEYGWMLSYAMKLCRNRMDAEDLVGDSVLKILCNACNFDSSRPFRPWASVIILNTYITKCNRENLVGFLSVEDSVPVPSWERTQSRALMSEILSAVRRCRRRSAAVDCVLMHACGYSYMEIAERFGIPQGTVRSRINYARKIIRNELEYNKLNNV